MTETNSSKNHSLLFIPDISGFTQFVTDTEINHSHSIIAELLESIIDSNQLELTVSEIEGDAILFYRYQEVPSIDELLEQTQKTFLDFHGHLKRYERDRVCNCGACRQAVQLSLKIIAHTGNITLIKIKNHQKLYGPAVIVVHRLLKNEIKENEYLLVTDSSISTIDKSHLGPDNDWAEIKEGRANYEDVGEISYKYIPLSPLHERVPPPEPLPQGKTIANPIVKEIYIERPVDRLFEILFNLELRTQWSKGVKRVEFDRGKIHRVGTKHTCTLNSGALKFETITNNFGENKRVYGERLTNALFMKEVNIYFILEPQGKGTKLRVESHYFPLPVIGWLFKSLYKSKAPKALESLLDSLKEYSEK
jgi:hypothetical protein